VEMQTREIAPAPHVRMTRRPRVATLSHCWEGGRAARGRLTVGRRGATPPSAVASPLKRARRPDAGPPPGVPGPILSYPRWAGSLLIRFVTLKQQNNTMETYAEHAAAGAHVWRFCDRELLSSPRFCSFTLGTSDSVSAWQATVSDCATSWLLVPKHNVQFE